MTAPVASSRSRTWFARLVGAALTVLAFLGAVPAEAATPFSQGYAAGQSAGRNHGFTDGYKNAYKASYVNEMINGRGGRTYSMPHPDYVRGYNAGYAAGYESGWNAGRRQGTVAGREDAYQDKLSLRQKMHRCMLYGGFYCRGLFSS
jgi:hypothetical protein